MRVLHSTTASEIERVGSSGPHRFNPQDFEAHCAELHLSAIGEDGDVQARCSLWWSNTPKYKQHRVGVIGHYAASTSEAAFAVLASAENQLRSTGCTFATGPMNGNTWRSYRFVTEAGDQPAFFLEPANPPEWPLHFETAGFSCLASYFSALNRDLSRPDARIEELKTRMAEAGVTIRSANSDLTRELDAIYTVSRISFQENFLYTEIPQAEFVRMYEPVLPLARPELVLLAERGGECVGYLFAIPNLAQAAQGLRVDTFIIKTVAILPSPELRGLGSLLVARAQRTGHALGFKHCIHALMFEDNVSLKISRRYATVMRKYTLYGKELAG
jgi:GNAT superfamily N-acetyltransferase